MAGFKNLQKTESCIADSVSKSFICLNCGAKLKYPEKPIGILRFARSGRRFMKTHENCKPKK